MDRNGRIKTWSDVYERFEGRCEYIGNTPSTMDQYNRIMGRFCAWADSEEINPAEIQPTDVSGYLENLRRVDGKSYSPNGRKAHARAVATLLNYGFDERIIDQKIKVRMPKSAEEKVQALTDEELSGVYGCVEARAEDGSPRDAAIVHVLKDSGVRAGELLALNWKDIAWDEDGQLGTIQVTKQMNRKREIVPTKNGKSTISSI